MLYNIILPESSMLFHVACDWSVTVWPCCHIHPNPESPEIKIKEKEIRKEEKIK